MEWGRVMGPLADQLKFSFLKEGVLMLEATNPMWVNESLFYRDQILDKVNAFFSGSYRVKQVKVQLSRSKLEIISSNSGYVGKSLEEKIRMEVERKMALGYVLCKYCRDVYTPEGICVFCRIASA